MRIPLRRTLGPNISGAIHKMWLKEVNRGPRPHEVKRYEGGDVESCMKRAADNVKSLAATRVLDRRTPVQALGKVD